MAICLLSKYAVSLHVYISNSFVSGESRAGKNVLS